MVNVNFKKSLININFILIIILVTFQNNNYILHEFWPSLDMITFFPTYFTNTSFGMDFMTSCFENFTGRYFVGHITGFIYPLFEDWFDFLLFYRIIIFIFLPVSWYLALKSLFKKNKLDLSVIITLLITSFLAQSLNSWVSIFSFATWSPYFFHFHPGTISSIFVLLGIFFAFKDNQNRVISYVFIILGALSHPIFSISITFIFVFSKYFIDKEVKSVFSILTLNVFITGLQSILSNFGNLGLDSYLEYFARFHPHHYVPSWENNLYEDVIKIAILFMIVYLIPIGENSKEFKILSGSFFSFFLLGLIVQYVAVELYPVSKLLILLSPSRFSSYIYWMFVIVVLFKFKNLLSTYEHYFMKILNNYVSILVFLVLNITIFTTQLNTINESGRLEKNYYLNQNEIEIIEWTKNNTTKNDLFLVLGSHRLNVFFTIETERGQYNAIGYPFNDNCIEENFIRKSNFYYKPVSEIVDYLTKNEFTEFNYFVTDINTDTNNLDVIFSNNQFKVIEVFK